MNWEFGSSVGKLLYIELINNKVLWYSTGNYIQYPVINHNGKEYERMYMYVYIYNWIIHYIFIYIYKLNHFASQQKLTQHCNQLYFNKINSKSEKKKIKIKKFPQFFCSRRHCFGRDPGFLLSANHNKTLLLTCLGWCCLLAAHSTRGETVFTLT